MILPPEGRIRQQEVRKTPGIGDFVKLLFNKDLADGQRESRFEMGVSVD